MASQQVVKKNDTGGLVRQVIGQHFVNGELYYWLMSVRTPSDRPITDRAKYYEDYKPSALDVNDVWTGMTGTTRGREVRIVGLCKANNSDIVVVYREIFKSDLTAKYEEDFRKGYEKLTRS